MVLELKRKMRARRKLKGVLPLLVRSAMLMALIFFFIFNLIDIYIPLAQGKRLLLYEDNRVIAFSEVAIMVVIIAFLIHEYVRFIEGEAEAQKP